MKKSVSFIDPVDDPVKDQVKDHADDHVDEQVEISLDDHLVRATFFLNQCIDLPGELKENETVLENLKKSLKKCKKGYIQSNYGLKFAGSENYIDIMEAATENNDISLLISYCPTSIYTGARTWIRIKKSIPIFFGSKGNCVFGKCDKDCFSTTGLCEIHSKKYKMIYPVGMEKKLVKGSPMTITMIMNRLDKLEKERDSALEELKRECPSGSDCVTSALRAVTASLVPFGQRLPSLGAAEFVTSSLTFIE
jgi:hypothetical protein